MLRRVLYAMGLATWCKEEGVYRHCNEGLTKPSKEFVSPREMVEISDGYFVTEL